MQKRSLKQWFEEGEKREASRLHVELISGAEPFADSGNAIPDPKRKG